MNFPLSLTLENDAKKKVYVRTPYTGLHKKSRKNVVSKSNGPKNFDDWMHDDKMEPYVLLLFHFKC